MITVLLIAIAAVMNATMDTIEHHWGVSVFNRWPKWIRDYMKRDWRARYVDRTPSKGFRKYRIGPFSISANRLDPIHDGWHLAKFIMIACFLLAPLFYREIVHPVVDFIIFWATWGIVFEGMYSYILRTDR